MSAPVTLNDWLSYCYKADGRKQLQPAINAFKAVLAGDAGMLNNAQTEMARLDSLVKERGRQACAYSAKYNDYLHEALGT